MALSDLVVRQAKATGKAYTLPDIDGLSLAVTATGSKSWHFRYYWMKEPKRMSLGTYPEVSLREARTLRDAARALVAKDVVQAQEHFSFLELGRVLVLIPLPDGGAVVATDFGHYFALLEATSAADLRRSQPEPGLRTWLTRLAATPLCANR